jgi:predicted  nucleic acid-binding Zn ribbon protein
MKCPCCGSEMKKEKELEHSFLMKCTGCGLSDTVVKS